MGVLSIQMVSTRNEAHVQSESNRSATNVSEIPKIMSWDAVGDSTRHRGPRFVSRIPYRRNPFRLFVAAW